MIWNAQRNNPQFFYARLSTSVIIVLFVCVWWCDLCFRCWWRCVPLRWSRHRCFLWCWHWHKTQLPTYGSMLLNPSLTLHHVWRSGKIECVGESVRSECVGGLVCGWVSEVVLCYQLSFFCRHPYLSTGSWWTRVSLCGRRTRFNPVITITLSSNLLNHLFCTGPVLLGSLIVHVHIVFHCHFKILYCSIIY